MYVLMLSVFKIRKFYKENKITEEMNSKAMVIHVLAFGGYVLSGFVLTVTTVLSFSCPKSCEKITKAFDISTVPVAVTAFISEILLCVIFW
jgi:hypothetical protein